MRSAKWKTTIVPYGDAVSDSIHDRDAQLLKLGSYRSKAPIHSRGRCMSSYAVSIVCIDMMLRDDQADWHWDVVKTLGLWRAVTFLFPGKSLSERGCYYRIMLTTHVQRSASTT
jgi:hypothetical protein